jgi:hypothetical protein
LIRVKGRVLVQPVGLVEDSGLAVGPGARLVIGTGAGLVVGVTVGVAVGHCGCFCVSIPRTARPLSIPSKCGDGVMPLRP